MQTAYEEMSLTKKFSHKENKTLGYHIIQSFKEDEVTPEKANEIGKELAQELWGDKFQVAICTHINKENVHNHMILNSVPFVDGKKYHNSNEEIALMRDTSDRLCLKYGLSIVETEKAKQEKVFRNKRIDNFNRSNEKMQKIRNDIDEAIKCVKRYSDFKFVLNAKGYEIYDKGKYFTIKPPYFSRNIRLKRAFGENYSLSNIKERIYYKNKEKLPIANFKTIQEIEKYQIACDNKLPELKSQRENLWRKYNKTTNKTQKVEIKVQINLLSEKIATINNYTNICGRCVIRFKKLRKEYIEHEQAKEKAQELIKEDKKKKARNR